ncbi:MAG: hypothetical protein LBL33_07350 [Tannerella sp.]|nr:hypothetical protein [Tannerella sp.]
MRFVTYVIKSITYVMNFVTYVMNSITYVTNPVTYVMNSITHVVNLVTYVMKTNNCAFFPVMHEKTGKSHIYNYKYYELFNRNFKMSSAILLFFRSENDILNLYAVEHCRGDGMNRLGRTKIRESTSPHSLSLQKT